MPYDLSKYFKILVEKTEFCEKEKIINIMSLFLYWIAIFEF